LGTVQATGVVNTWERVLRKGSAWKHPDF